MGVPARKRRAERVFRPLLPASGGGGVDPPPAPPATSHPATTTTPPPVVDELLELELRRFRFRGARAFLWQYREQLEVVRRVLQELDQARESEVQGSSQGIRNPGGLIRWRVRQEVGDGDA